MPGGPDLGTLALYDLGLSYRYVNLCLLPCDEKESRPLGDAVERGLEFGRRLHGLSVDLKDDVLRPQARGGGRAFGIEIADDDAFAAAETETPCGLGCQRLDGHPESSAFRVAPAARRALDVLRIELLDRRLERLRPAVAQKIDTHRRARSRTGDPVPQRVGVRELLTVDADDHVTLLQAGALRGGSGFDAAHEGAADVLRA